MGSDLDLLRGTDGLKLAHWNDKVDLDVQGVRLFAKDTHRTHDL